jgi:EAL domain-containing protein (putative c-di-GMP-specific phosphodiesterase class I)/CheY-like chemotaxis protein
MGSGVRDGVGPRPTDLCDALARREIAIAVQPLVDLRSGAVTRMEALARWHHPTRGDVAPTSFIAVAERSSLVTTLTFEVVREVARHLPAWRALVPELRVGVNVSPVTLLDPTFPKRLARVLSEVGCEGSWFGVEITEAALMRDGVRSQRAIEELNAMDVRIDLDDFGAGYSSLGQLAELAIGAVKIDRRFVERMTTEHRREAIVRATIALGHDLGFEVVAEGVEDRETWQLLSAHGCDTAQGFHVARPMAPAQLPEWLDSWSAGIGFIRRSGIGTDLLRGAEPVPTERDGLVLVVDDEPSILEVIRDILQGHGFHVMTASNGAEAMRLVEETVPDVVLLDMNMPVLDGAGFATAVRDRGLRVPIVVMTAGASAPRWARELRADAYLSKPFELTGLVEIAKRFARPN